ncbi:MAG: hypothetical protein ACFE85_14630 [Candidatus Hodarchaeota archaeon]
MSEKVMENFVKEFIKKVKKALPDWLKDKKENKDILIDLEEHIWTKAKELSETGQATEESVRKAISHMGTPESIAKEYKKRGTPKVYITKEMWPLYLKVIGVVFTIVIALNVLAQIVDVIFNGFNLGQFIVGLVQGLQIGLLFSFTIITIIFVVLSMEGYFPEDFKSKKQLEKEKYAIEGIIPIKPFIKPVGEIIGGGIQMIIGVIFIIQPFPVTLLNPDFLLLLRIFGLFIIGEGTFDMTRGIIGNRQPGTHQVIHLITLFIKAILIPFVIVLMNRPEIIPWLQYDNVTETFINIGMSPEFYDAFRWGMIAIIVIIILTGIEDLYRVFKIEKYRTK